MLGCIHQDIPSPVVPAEDRLFDGQRTHARIYQMDLSEVFKWSRLDEHALGLAGHMCKCVCMAMVPSFLQASSGDCQCVKLILTYII